jgi:hypothetical protein
MAKFIRLLLDNYSEDGSRDEPQIAAIVPHEISNPIQPFIASALLLHIPKAPAMNKLLSKQVVIVGPLWHKALPQGAGAIPSKQNKEIRVIKSR